MYISLPPSFTPSLFPCSLFRARIRLLNRNHSDALKYDMSVSSTLLSIIIQLKVAFTSLMQLTLIYWRRAFNVITFQSRCVFFNALPFFWNELSLRAVFFLATVNVWSVCFTFTHAHVCVSVCFVVSLETINRVPTCNNN